MAGYRSSYAGADRPDPAEVQEAERKKGGLNWRLWLGIAVTGVALLSCTFGAFFLVALIDDPKGTSNQMTSLFHEVLTTAQLAIPLLALVGLAYAAIHLRFKWMVKPIYARDERFPALVDARGHVTMLDDQRPRLEHLHSLNGATLDALPAPSVVEADEDQTPKLPQVHFRDMATRLGPGQLLIGVRQDGTPRIGTWDEYKSVLVVGDSSSGKTNTIAQLIAQAVQFGALLVVCDPHAFKKDSLKNKIKALSPFFYPGTGVAVQHPEILQQVHLVREELERRVSGSRADRVVLLVVEEWNRLQRDQQIADELMMISEILGQEGRGFGIYGVFAAQSMVGFAKVRRAFISNIVHRVDEIEARLLLPAPLAKLAPDLPKGATLVKDADGKTELLQQALITAQDIDEVARLAPPVRQPMAWSAPSRTPAAEEVYALPTLPMKPGRVPLDTPAIAAIDQRLAALALAEERASAPVSAPAPSAVAAEEEEINTPALLDIRPYLDAQKQQKQKEQKPLFTPEEWNEVLRLHFVEGVPKSRILPELRKLGISKDGNLYHDMSRMLEEARAQAAVEDTEPDEDEAVVVSIDESEGA